jgi:aryl carrier-like protein
VALTLDLIRADVADILGEDPADLPVDEDLVDYGLDSIRVMALVGRWTETHGVSVDFAALAKRPTLEGWTELLGEAG